MKVLATLGAALVAVGCFTPPAPAPVRTATLVDAGFEETWAAVIDHFAESNVPITTIDKASGLIATERLTASSPRTGEYADCGTDSFVPFIAHTVIYNVLVRGDESTSTVRVTASWDAPQSRCNTTGVWEGETEAAIKTRAEGS